MKDGTESQTIMNTYFSTAQFYLPSKCSQMDSNDPRTLRECGILDNTKNADHLKKNTFILVTQWKLKKISVNIKTNFFVSLWKSLFNTQSDIT